MGLLGRDTQTLLNLGTHAYPKFKVPVPSLSPQTRREAQGFDRGNCNRLKSQRAEGSKKGKERKAGEGGRQAGKELCPGLRPPSRQEEVQHSQEGAPSPPGRRFTEIYSRPPVKLSAESADWLRHRLSHQCSLIAFCKQNACCLVTFHLSLTFPESYCYPIRFTLSSCDYCNLLHPGVHPSGKRKVGCVSRGHGHPPDL